MSSRHIFSLASLIPVLITSLLAQSHQVQRLPPIGSRAPVAGYTVRHVYPHDPRAFTQGIEYRGGVLYEGTGLNGESKLRQVELTTGKVRIKQVRSGIGHSWKMNLTLRAIGLKHHQDEVIKQDNPALRGQLKQVRHLIEVVPVEE